MPFMLASRAGCISTKVLSCQASNHPELSIVFETREVVIASGDQDQHCNWTCYLNSSEKKIIFNPGWDAVPRD